MTQMQVDVPAGLLPGATFPVQTATGVTTVTVPQGHQPGQKIQFTATQPQAPPQAAPTSQMCEVEAPPGSLPGSTFQVQSPAGLSTVTVPQGYQPGQKIQFCPVAAFQPQAYAPVVDPRTMPDEFPLLQVIFIGGAYLIGGFSSWGGLCYNLCCRPPPTERERQAAWYTNVTAAINFGHLAVLVVCLILVVLLVDMGFLIFIGVHLNIFSMCFTNGGMLALQLCYDQKIEQRQRAERASPMGPSPNTVGAPMVVGMPVQVGNNK